MVLSDQGITPSLANMVSFISFTCSFDIFYADTLPLAIGLIIHVKSIRTDFKGNLGEDSWYW